MKKSKIKNRTRQFDKESYGSARNDNRIVEASAPSYSSDKKVVTQLIEIWCFCSKTNGFLVEKGRNQWSALIFHLGSQLATSAISRPVNRN